jgi:two-component system response regulator YesN
MFFFSPEDVVFLRFSYRKNIPAMAFGPLQTAYIDLTYCLKGEMHYIIDGKTVILHGGDAVLFPAGAVRHRLESQVNCTYASFNVVLNNSQEPEISGFLPKCATAKAAYILERFREDNSEETSQKKEKGALLFLYLYHQLLEDAVYADTPHIQRIQQFISKNLSQAITLKDIAAHVHLAPEYVCSLFKKHTGQTLSQYIIQQRVEQAKLKIITTQLSMREIAETCGFRDYCYFSNTFKKITGMSPSQYQKSVFV